MTAETESLLGHDWSALRSQGSRGWRAGKWVESQGGWRVVDSEHQLSLTMKDRVKDFFAVKNIKSKFPIATWIRQYS